MKQTYVKYLMVATFAGGFLFTSCRTARETTAQYEVTKVEGSMITIDSVWDTIPNAKAAEILKPYKEKVDAMMYEVIGTSAMKMDKGGPESLLSNLVAGVLQQAAVQVLGKPADMGLVNMGGLRNILPEGDITVGDVFEILPFENSLCVLTMKGTDLRRLFEAIASLHGEGVSGIRLEITIAPVLQHRGEEGAGVAVPEVGLRQGTEGFPLHQGSVAAADQHMAVKALQ